MELLEFFSKIGKLKDIERTGWNIYSVEKPESVADHSFRVALMAMLYAKKQGLNVEKCIKMALVHDLDEVHTKDIATRANKKDQVVTEKEKNQLEEAGAKKLFSLLSKNSSQEFIELWEDYFNLKSEEAKLVFDLDKIEMVLQALEYQKAKRSNEILEEFFQTSEPRIQTEFGKKLWQQIRKEFLAEIEKL
jgi:putative hydrolase of HD superfamily